MFSLFSILHTKGLWFHSSSQGCRFVSVVGGGGDDRCQNIFGNGSKQPRGRSVWQVAPLPSKLLTRSQDFILGGTVVSTRSASLTLGGFLGGWMLGGGVSRFEAFPARSALKRSDVSSKLLEKEDDSLDRSRLLILVWIKFPFLRA